MSSGHRSFRAKWRGTVFSTDTPEPAIHFTTPMTTPFVAAMTLLSATLSFAHACGEVVTIPTHGNTTTRYAFASPPDAKGTLVLLAGGGGHLDLDDKGCPRALTGNSLARSMPHFHALGFATALVDAPSDYPGDDGLGGFRIAADHADDLGIVIADVRVRAKVPVWLIGTSRGSISAANAAARLSGPAAADGVVLTSALMYGNRGQKLWVTQKNSPAIWRKG